MTMMKRVALLSAISLTACGGGGLNGATAGGSTSGGNSSNADIGGVWSGTVSNGSSSDAAIALITDSGSGALIDQSTRYINRFSASTSGDSVSGTYRGFAPSGFTYPGGATTETGTLAGTVTPSSSLNGSYSSSTGSGSFGLAFNTTQYNRASSFAALADTYTYSYTTSGTTLSYSLTVDSSGTIGGTVSNSCSLSGNVGIPNGAVNLYTLTFHEICGTSSTNFTGFATLTPASGTAKATLTLEYDDGLANAVYAVAAGQ